MLERRDLGDWFSADPRLFVADRERSDLVVAARLRAAAVASVLSAAPVENLRVHAVVCFGTVSAGWVGAPFSLDGVSVTWRRHLVEPMLTPVVLDPATRATLTRWLASTSRAA